MRKKIVIIFIMIFIVTIGIYLYFEFWIPNQRISNVDWLKYASHNEKRQMCHKVLRFPWGSHHNAFLISIFF